MEKFNHPVLINKSTDYKEIFKNTKIRTKDYYSYSNNGLFNLGQYKRLIIMSDIHSITPKVIDDLIKSKKIDKDTIVITTGDMAGNGKMGGDADPYNDYLKINQHAGLFYFVQGNHDTYNPKCKDLVNSDGTYCCVEGRLQNTPLGTISGVNGIETIEKKVNKDKHKYDSELYNKRLRFTLKGKPDILLTHQPIEKDLLKKYHLPKYHIHGHNHFDNHFRIEDYVMINLDNKIMEFINDQEI